MACGRRVWVRCYGVYVCGYGVQALGVYVWLACVYALGVCVWCTLCVCVCRYIDVVSV